MTASHDPYTDPKTGVLVNKLGITDPDRLRQAEADFTKTRIAQLREEPLSGNYDLKHLQAFHKHIMGDVYPWAGEIRTVPMSKGNSMFARPEYIESEGNKLFAGLKAENHLKGLDTDKFTSRVSHFIVEANALHSFREGNGRAQFALFEQLGREAGHPLDFSRINHQTLVLAATMAHAKGSSFFEPVVRSALAHGQRLEAERTVPPAPSQQEQRGSIAALDRVTHPLQAALERRALAMVRDGDGGAHHKSPLGEQIAAILDERGGWSASAPRNAEGRVAAFDAAKLPPASRYDMALDRLEQQLRSEGSGPALRPTDAWRVAYGMVAHVEDARSLARMNAEAYLKHPAGHPSLLDTQAGKAERTLHTALKEAQPLTKHTEQLVSGEIRRAISVQLARGEVPDADARMQAGVRLHVAERNLQTALDNRAVNSSGPQNIRPEERRLLAAYADSAAGRFEGLTPRQQDQARANFMDAGAGDGKSYETTSAGNVLSRRTVGTPARPLEGHGSQSGRFEPQQIARQLAHYDYPRADSPFQQPALARTYQEHQQIRAGAEQDATRSQLSDRSAGYSPGR